MVVVFRIHTTVFRGKGEHCVWMVREKVLLSLYIAMESEASRKYGEMLTFRKSR